MAGYDVVLRGGRVVDPESGVDEVRNVGITGRQIAAISDEPLDGATVLDASGQVVAPGFIDLHSHAQTLAGRRLHACDGVTTVLDLEAGRAPVNAAYERDAQLGSPVHYGFSASWGAARVEVLGGGRADGGAGTILDQLADPGWARPGPA